MQWSRLDSLTVRQLRVFCAVARHLSYTRAAKELGCQQPTVSALVAELERATQLTLLEQWGKRLTLTNEGHELYAHAQQVGQVDLVITGRPPAIDGLVAEPFLPNPLVTVASPKHGLANERYVPLAYLTNDVFLLREVGSGTRAAVEELFEVAGLPLKIGMVLGHIEAIKQAVTAGLGISVLSEVAVKREVLTHRLVILQVEHFPIQRRWYIARLAAKPLTANTTTFIEFLRDYRLQHERDS